MNRKVLKTISLILALACLFFSFTGCEKKKVIRITDVISEAEKITINGKESKTVEARMGAFKGKQGDYIEFSFPEEQTFNTIFVTEKTTSIRQYNIFAKIDNKFKLIYTGKNILNQDIIIETTTADGLRFEVVNTEIGNDEFIIQGISAYFIEENESSVSDTNANWY